jgi:tartronate-semialdehyde synthase
MNYAVNIDFDESYGIDHVKVMEGMGALGRRVERPEDIRDALEWAVATAEERRRPVLVEIITERETNAPMGAALDAIIEFEPADLEPRVPALEG